MAQVNELHMLALRCCRTQKSNELHMCSSVGCCNEEKQVSEDAAVRVPCHIVREILKDGCCPLHLRTHLVRLLADPLGAGQSGKEATGFFDGLDGGSVAAITAFLPLADLLAVRTASSDLLNHAMRRPLEERQFDMIPLPSLPAPEETPAADRTTPPGPEPSFAIHWAVKSPAVCVHDRIRVRLWLQRLAALTTGCADEAIFESRVRSFVDTSMRLRMEVEVAAAKHGMEEEVRAAKYNMLQCVQAISEEVDRRVRDKVAALQEEFDKRAQDQDLALREMVEERFSQQTAAMKAEVDRRSNHIRDELEARAKVQESVASKLQAEVVHIREELEQRVHEQEVTVLRLTTELECLRVTFAEVAVVRLSLEGKVALQEDAVLQLTHALNALRTEYGVERDRIIARSSTVAPRKQVVGQPATACWAWMNCLR